MESEPAWKPTSENTFRYLRSKVQRATSQPTTIGVHVGLGTSPQVDELVLRWPSGKVQTVRNLPAGYLHVISEDRGVIGSTKLAPRAAATASSAAQRPRRQL